MRIGAFEVSEPLPELKEPHAFASLEPWINAGDVGTLIISWLENHTEARPLAKLARPGNFFDFTRYRPLTFWRGGQRELDIPNTRITFSRQQEGLDFLFLHLLEPHMLGETYVDSIVRLLERFGTIRFSLIGSMYNFVPHTRPPLVYGSASTQPLKDMLEKAGVSSSNYEGPTTICTLISQKAAGWGAENMTMIVSLPQYTHLEEDYIGALRVQEIIASLYDIPVPENSINKAKRQRDEINTAVAGNPQVQEILERLEETYDAGVNSPLEPEEPPPLSPEVEKFLSEMEKRFRRE